MSRLVTSAAAGGWSRLMIGGSLLLATGFLLGIDVILATSSVDTPMAVLGGALLFNATVLLQAGVGAHLRDSLDLDELNCRLAAAVDETVQPSRAGLWVRAAER